MKYIKKVILENFQSHKYTEVEFDQYLNVIVGPSDHGKTAIIRALKWALFNEPSGDFFIREGEKECSVTVMFNDNTKVKRFRSKNKNTYYLYDEEGKETVFEGFGTNVPQEIIDKTSMRKVALDSNQSNSINIGEQLEGPFLLSEKNAVRANAIGRLVGVHIIDDALKDTLKDVRNLNIKKKSHEETLEILEENLNEYDYLDDLIEKTKQVERIKNNIFNNQIKLGKLIQISIELKKNSEEIKLTREYLKNLENLDKAIDIGKKLNVKINNFSYINNKYNKLVQIQKQITHDNKLLISLKEVHKTEEIIDIINLNYIKMTRLNMINLNYNNITNNIIKNKKTLLKLQEIHNMEIKIDLIEKSYLKLTGLLNLKYKLDNVNKSLSIGVIYTDKLSNIDVAFSIQNSLRIKNDKLKKLIDYKAKYDSINIKRLEVEKNILNIDKNLNEQLKQYKLILTKIEVCPLCFSTIDASKIDEIVNNYK